MADCSSVDPNELLLEACKAGDVEKLREAIAAGADVEAKWTREGTSQTPLCAVVCELDVKRDRAEKGRTACVRALLAAGASASAAVVFHRDHEEPCYTALHEAAYDGFATICRLLLDAGAALNARDFDNTLPLQYAAESRHHRTVVLLLSRGATIDGCEGELWNISQWYHSRITRAGGFANYQKQQRAELMALLAPKMSHLLPPELVSHVITFWGHLGWT